MTLKKEIQSRDLFVTRKVKPQRQAQTDGTVYVDVSKSESHLSQPSRARSGLHDFDVKKRLQIIQNLMPTMGLRSALNILVRYLLFLFFYVI